MAIKKAPHPSVVVASSRCSVAIVSSLVVQRARWAVVRGVYVRLGVSWRGLAVPCGASPESSSCSGGELGACGESMLRACFKVLP